MDAESLAWPSLATLSRRTWPKAEIDKVIVVLQQLFAAFKLKDFQNFASSCNGLETSKPSSDILSLFAEKVNELRFENEETQVVSQLECLAPTSLAESWDNVGLLIEPSGSKEVGRSVNVIICKDSSTGQESLADK